MTEEEEEGQGDQLEEIVKEKMWEIGYKHERDWWIYSLEGEDAVCVEVEDPDIIIGTMEEIATMSRKELLARLEERVINPDDLYQRLATASHFVTQIMGQIEHMPSQISTYMALADLKDILEGRQHGR